MHGVTNQTPGTHVSQATSLHYRDFTDGKTNFDPVTQKQDIFMYVNYENRSSRNMTGGGDVGCIEPAEDKNK